MLNEIKVLTLWLCFKLAGIFIPQHAMGLISAFWLSIPKVPLNTLKHKNISGEVVNAPHVSPSTVIVGTLMNFCLNAVSLLCKLIWN